MNSIGTNIYAPKTVQTSSTVMGRVVEWVLIWLSTVMAYTFEQVLPGGSVLF